MAIAVTLVALGLAACAGPGTSSAPISFGPASSSTPLTSATAGPSGTATAGPAGTSASIAPTPSGAASSSTFALTTTAFPAGGEIPARFTCDGDDLSPDVAWSGAPDGTAAFLLVVDDPDASGFVHWIMFDLPGASSGTLPIGFSSSPHPPPQGRNDFGTVGWRGPCPPSGEHRYRFTLSALDAPLGLSGAPNASAVRQALARVEVLGTATLEGRYRRR
jgi:Raf kinase inhibitor-like YbhB/YbcL family protein